jgi:hypothetical protein
LDAALDLAPQNGVSTLKEYFDQFVSRTNFERNLIFVSYLQDVRGLAVVTLDQIYTSYREVNVKVPEALDDSLYDTNRKKGWLDTSSLSGITLTTRGRNYLNHELSRAKA